VYGSNENNINFYRKLKRDINEIGNPVLIGGDFNTIFGQYWMENNLDKIGIGRVPNRTNSNFIKYGFGMGKELNLFVHCILNKERFHICLIGGLGTALGVGGQGQVLIIMGRRDWFFFGRQCTTGVCKKCEVRR
jgi:hypothetical protein